MRQAASILEEEIAAGILAARQLEDRFIDSEELRSGDPAEILPRFRRDAHEVIDIVIDVISATALGAGQLAKKAISIRAGAQRSIRAGMPSTPIVATPAPIKSGSTGDMSLIVENDGETATDAFKFYCTDLVDAAGHTIRSSRITFEPAEVTLRPHHAESITVRISVPAGTVPGGYSGLIQSSRNDGLRAALTVTVE